MPCPTKYPELRVAMAKLAPDATLVWKFNHLFADIETRRNLRTVVRYYARSLHIKVKAITVGRTLYVIRLPRN